MIQILKKFYFLKSQNKKLSGSYLKTTMIIKLKQKRHLKPLRNVGNMHIIRFRNPCNIHEIINRCQSFQLQ